MNARSLSLVSTLALFGALGSAQATTTGGFGACPGISTGGERSSVVLSDVQAGSPNTYNFKVCNNSSSEGESTFLLRDWELPYDPAGGIAGYVTPTGWGSAIEPIGQANPATGWDGDTPTWFNVSDPFYDARYLGLDQVIHFYTCGGDSSCYGSVGDVFADPISPGDSLEGFGFTSPYGVTDAPYQASWVQQRPRSGDPAFPQPVGGPNTPGLRNSVPEPGGLALFALSLGALMAARARRRGRKAD